MHCALKGMIMWSDSPKPRFTFRPTGTPWPGRPIIPSRLIPTVAVDPPVVQSQHIKCLAEFVDQFLRGKTCTLRRARDAPSCKIIQERQVPNSSDNLSSAKVPWSVLSLAASPPVCQIGGDSIGHQRSLHGVRVSFCFTSASRTCWATNKMTFGLMRINIGLSLSNQILLRHFHCVM